MGKQEGPTPLSSNHRPNSVGSAQSQLFFFLLSFFYSSQCPPLSHRIVKRRETTIFDAADISKLFMFMYQDLQTATLTVLLETQRNNVLIDNYWRFHPSCIANALLHASHIRVKEPPAIKKVRPVNIPTDTPDASLWGVLGRGGLPWPFECLCPQTTTRLRQCHTLADLVLR